MNLSNAKDCSIPCNICSSYDIEVLSLIGREWKYLRTVICKECGLVWTDPRPFEVRKYYEKDYRLEYKGTHQPKLKHIYRAAMVALSRFRKIEKFLINGSKVLDSGSGGGEFIYLLSKFGYDVTGIEPNIGYAEYSKQEYNLDVLTGFVQDVDISSNNYDVITMWHVLEHTDNPFQILYHLNSRLKNNGILIVEVPNVEAVCQAPINRFHRAHLYNFNLNTLERVGSKAGFVPIVKEVSIDGANIFMVFRKDKISDPSGSLTIKGNAQQIINIIRKHTNLRHYTSPFPYTRFLRKIAKIFREWNGVKGFSRGKEILDYYYNKYHKNGSHR